MAAQLVPRQPMNLVELTLRSLGESGVSAAASLSAEDLIHAGVFSLTTLF